MPDDELTGHLVVGRQRRLCDVPFEARVDAELALRDGRRSNGEDAGERHGPNDHHELRCLAVTCTPYTEPARSIHRSAAEVGIV